MKTFSTANIHLLDNGKAARAIDHAMRQCIADVTDRPAEDKPRKVVVEFEFTPKTEDESGVLDNVQVRARIKTALPVRQTRHYPMLPMGDGVVGFQPHSPDDPRQGELYDPAKETVNKDTGEVTKAKPGEDEDDDSPQNI